MDSFIESLIKRIEDIKKNKLAMARQAKGIERYDLVNALLGQMGLCDQIITMIKEEAKYLPKTEFDE